MNGRDRLLGRLSTACPVCWWVWNLAYVGGGIGVGTLLGFEGSDSSGPLFGVACLSGSLPVRAWPGWACSL